MLDMYSVEINNIPGVKWAYLGMLPIFAFLP